jgi:triosephosphate isomerase
MTTKKKLIAGNWKMNGNLEANDALVRALVAGVKDVAARSPSACRRLTWRRCRC